MKSYSKRENKHFQPIVLTVVFETLKEADDFIAHNEEEYPDMCEDLERDTS